MVRESFTSLLHPNPFRAPKNWVTLAWHHFGCDEPWVTEGWKNNEEMNTFIPEAMYSMYKNDLIFDFSCIHIL